MVVVTGIKAAIKIAPIIFKVGKVLYKAGSKTRAGNRFISRHPKILRAGTIAAASGTLVYDILNIDYDSLIGPTPSRNRKQQTRGYIQSTRSRQFYKADCPPVYSRRRSRQKQFYRS